MNTSDFTYLLQHPDSLEASKISDVRSVIDEFPYFQSARALYLKGLKDSQSFRYNQELKVTAAYTTDRSVLFDFITSDVFEQNQISDKIKYNFEHLKDIDLYDIEDLSTNDSVSIDIALKAELQEEPITMAKVDEPLVVEREIIIEEAIDTPDPSPEEKLEIGKPLEFDKTEMHSFSEWLKITSFKPIIREESLKPSEKPSKEEKAKKLDLIDKFIETNPKIPPVSVDAPKKNMAKSRMMQPESLMTETLARIYLEQKNYDKAIQAYHILSLKYPEKSGFFADQIQAVKELQEQNKQK